MYSFKYITRTHIPKSVRCLCHMGRRLRTNDNRCRNNVKTASAGNNLSSVHFVLNQPIRYRSDESKDLSSLIQPITIKPCNDLDGINVGAEITGAALQKGDLLKLLNKFWRRDSVKKIAFEHGLDDRLFHQAYVSFRRFCVESEALPVDLHIILSDILQASGHVDDLMPFFLSHSMTMFPHLECMDDLKKISDIRHPAHWYPEARAIQRKIIYHAGPTNSGKTYHALERYFQAKSGVYCGPLRLLANEVFFKCNNAGTACDLVTGEERRLADPTGENPAGHVACTVEMTSVTSPYEVAVIDEIQMLRDTGRGWAWTRALLGVCAQEIHVCGEGAAINIVQKFAEITGDEFEVRKYKRLTPLTVQTKAVEKFEHIQAGDCIVCFSKNDIYHVSRQLEKRGVEVAVIYGGLPPGTKMAQAEKFNDPENPCKVMVSTDAIGMGLNLNIKRIIFYSLMKPMMNEKGEKEIDVLPATAALQIAGRAGRYNTSYADGQVTTFKTNDLPTLQELLKTKVEDVQLAGLNPTPEQIELFAYHLPKATLSNLIDIFVTISQVDNTLFFMCNVDDFKFLADMIEHVPLQLRTRYVFCCAPIPKKQPFVCTMFLKFARRFSKEQPLTLDWVCRQIGWPFSPPSIISDLVHLEGVFDVLDLYLWLSYRFPDMFPDTEHIRDMQQELDQIIRHGVFNITNLLKNTENNISTGIKDDEDDFEMRNRQKKSGIKDYAEEEDEDDLGPSILGNNSSPSLSERFKKAKGLDKNRPLTSQLLETGILTKEMLAKLQKELSDQNRKGGRRK